MTQNPNELAGAANTGRPPVAPIVPEPKEVFPLQFDKDYLDFRGKPEDDELVPKASSAPVSVETPRSPTGLEDVYEDDSVTNALNNVGRDMTSPPASGS